ncbi:MAG: MFS transporter [Pyrinomonadaceae bacterium]
MTTDPPVKRSIRSYARGLTAWQMLARRDFRLLWLGQSVSILGDQFYLVALPWLVLRLTGSSLALGSILLTHTIMRAAFQLVGGAISDMFSQRKMMIASSVVRATICAILTALVVLNKIHLWHLFIIVAVFGMADAFFTPALKAFIPGIIPKESLVAGNSLLNTSSLLAMFLGPSLAGVLIAVMGTGGAFAFDTASFVFVAGCLLLMRSQPSSDAAPEQIIAKANVGRAQLLTSIREGLRYTYYEPTLRALITITAVVEFAFAGPFTVGLASLANVKFAGGATAFGAMLSSLGGGLLVGTLMVGATHTKYSFGKTILWLTTGLGFGLTLLGLVPNVIWACVLMAVIGIISGHVQVLVASWLQTKSDPLLRGRVMSVVMLGAFGLTPLSYVLTGALTQISVSFMFIVTGLFLLVALAFCAFGSSGRALILSR